MAEEKTLTFSQLQDGIKGAVAAALGEWSLKNKPATPAQPNANLSQEGEAAKNILDVYIDGKPVKAELLDGRYQVKMGQAAMAGADSIAGAIEAGDQFKVLGVAIPIVSAVVGTSVGVVWGGVVDSLWAPKKAVVGKDGAPVLDDAGTPKQAINWINPAAQAGGVILALKFGPKYMGKAASYFAAGALIMKVLINYTPLAGWLAKLEEKIEKPLKDLKSNAGMGQDRSSPAFSQRLSVREFPAPAASRIVPPVQPPARRGRMSLANQ